MTHTQSARIPAPATAPAVLERLATREAARPLGTKRSMITGRSLVAAAIVAGNLATAFPVHAEPTTYAVPARSYGTQPETDPPRYVRSAHRTGIAALKEVDWLDLGLDFRERYERREDDLRRSRLATDHPFLHRTRAYVGLRERLDPLRFALEFEDARRSNGLFPRDTRDVNEYELIQGYGELHFGHALGQDARGNARPIRLRVGRMSWESLDRRLLGNNQWRNTTNNHEGFRLNLGQEANDWELDLWGVQPILRDLEAFDTRDDDVWFYGGILNWRAWSDVITLQPHFLGLRQAATATRPAREVHAPGLRAYGVIPDTAWDFDASVMHQFGEDAGRRKEAWAGLIELGYVFPHPWRPRISAFYAYASGDRDPRDTTDHRFERFFGFARPWSADDYIVFENVETPRMRLELKPHQRWQLDAGYAAYWLASDRDRFNNLLGGINGEQRFNRDPTGNSGSFLGHALDLRIRYAATERIDATLGYSHWINGGFVRSRQQATLGERAERSDFLYFEIVINAFSRG